MILPTIAPIFLAVAVVQLQFAIKTFDLAVALTSGGPGISTTFPAIYVYDLMFQRGEIGEGAAARDDDARGARRGAGALFALSSSGAGAGRPAMADAVARRPRRRPRGAPRAAAGALISRVVIYGLLALFAIIYIVPLLVVVFNSFRDQPEIARNGLIAFPQSFRLDAWPQAWSDLLHRRHLRGHAAQLLELAVDDDPGDDHLDRARRHQRLHPLASGASRARRSLFTCMLLGVFMPGPDRADALGLHPRQARPRQLGLRPGPRPRASRASRFTTLFCRNYYVGIPDDLIKAARIDGAGFWRIFCKIILPLSPPILIVTVIWQFTGIWNEYLFGVVLHLGRQPADHRGAGRAHR